MYVNKKSGYSLHYSHIKRILNVSGFFLFSIDFNDSKNVGGAEYIQKWKTKSTTEQSKLLM